MSLALKDSEAYSSPIEDSSICGKLTSAASTNDHNKRKQVGIANLMLHKNHPKSWGLCQQTPSAQMPRRAKVPEDISLHPGYFCDVQSAPIITSSRSSSINLLWICCMTQPCWNVAQGKCPGGRLKLFASVGKVSQSIFIHSSNFLTIFQISRSSTCDRFSEKIFFIEAMRQRFVDWFRALQVTGKS